MMWLTCPGRRLSLVPPGWMWLLLFIARASQGHTPRMLLNALDESGLAASIQFLALRPPNMSATLFLHKHLSEEMSSTQSQKEMFARQTVGVGVHHYSVSPFPDKSRSRIIKQQEQVSYILEALQKTMGEMRATGGVLLSLALKNGVKMHPTPQFSRIFGLLDGQAADVLLLPKNKGLTSISDWHDLFVLGLNASKPEAHEWLDAFASTYRHHADRQAFTVLEPRPSLLAATAKTRARTKVGFFSHEDIRRVGGEPEDADRHHQHARGLLEVFCHEVRGEGERCMVNEPTHWLRRVERGGVPKTYTSRVVGNHLKATELEQNLPHGMWDGSLRFFKPRDDVTPRPFCWETSTTEAEEQVAPARLVFNATLSLPYEHPAPEARPKGKLTAVMLTGMEVSAHRLDQKLYINLSKMMYCKRHGYKFLQLSSNQFRHYFDPHTFENMTNGNKGGPSDGGWFSGYISKVPMVVTAMLQNADKDWVVWTDDDVYLNPGWSYLPLDAFLGDVPTDKVFVAGNYRSSFTNIFALRNTDAGRRLAIDWLAVAQSGYVECHGYDQAAIQTLILLRAARTMDEPFPFNHTCLWSQDGETGCNMKGDWSCDFDFERSMYFAGFKSEMQTNFFDLRLSSYTKGCANAAIPDFHVITESPTRPRFQCGHCTRLGEVFSSGHWDGPLGGGNDKHRRGGVNGWFSNHKAEFLFWEGFLNPKGCARVEGVVPPCDHETGSAANNGSSSSSAAASAGGGGHGGRGQHPHHAQHAQHAQGGHALSGWERHIVSVVDGYGFDLRVGSYCRITDPVALKQQQETTYMKEYPTLIRAGRTYSDERWAGVYRNFSGGEGRAPCQGKVGPGTSCDHGQGPDGQKQKTPITVDSENDYFERAPDYCSGCVSITRPHTAHSPAVAVVDCRLERDVKAEYVRNQSQVMDAFDLRSSLFPNIKR